MEKSEKGGAAREQEQRARRQAVVRILREKFYDDEPIPAPCRTEPLPEGYRAAREAAKDRRQAFSDAALFVRQGKLLAAQTDEYEAPALRSYSIPCYQNLSDEELRGYVGWRTRHRRGDPTDPPAFFLKLYAYELINGIGISSPEEGLRRLSALMTFSSQPSEGWTPERVTRWMMEYAAYYKLDRSLLWEDPIFLANCPAFQQEILTDAEDEPDKRVFAALCRLSRYDLPRSKLYRDQPELFQAGICALYRAAARVYEKQKGRTLCDLLFGAFCESPCLLFGDAIFLREKKDADGQIFLSPRIFFRCRDGFWSYHFRMGFFGKSRTLGQLLRTADRLLRDAIGFSSPLKREDCPVPGAAEAMQRAAAAFVKENREPPPPAPPVFDRSLLINIRRAADRTRDRLLENSEDAMPEDPQTPPPQPEAAPPVVLPPEKATAADLGLGAGERLLLRALLTGADPAAALRERGFVLSMTADAVNDKLFDRIGDTVLLFDGEKPFLAEDYIEEIKGWMHL